jgi:hypothetical protein
MKLSLRNQKSSILTWSLRTLMLVAFIAAPFAIKNLAAHTARSDDDPDSHPNPLAGMISTSELLEIRVTKSFEDLAKRNYASAVPQNHEDLCRTLELENQQDAVYVLTFRFRTVDGHATDIRYIKKPYDQSIVFPECQSILLTLTGRVTQPPAVDFGRIIKIVPDEQIFTEETIVTTNSLSSEAGPASQPHHSQQDR